MMLSLKIQGKRNDLDREKKIVTYSDLISLPQFRNQSSMDRKIRDKYSRANLGLPFLMPSARGTERVIDMVHHYGKKFPVMFNSPYKLHIQFSVVVGRERGVVSLDVLDCRTRWNTHEFSHPWPNDKSSSHSKTEHVARAFWFWR